MTHPDLAVPTAHLSVVTGAFSYSGAAIARELLRRGRRVRTLTGHPQRAPAGTPIEVRPLDFGASSELAAALAGAGTLYNTYWIRFAHGAVDHAQAVANSRVLFGAAAKAGVQRIVHISITNPSLTSPDSYFRGKAEVEQALAECGVPYAVARPAVLFGRDGVLINNIAWLLRRLPVFAIGGRGDYRLRPIHVDDLAALCADLGARTEQAMTVDAVGPQSLTFRQIVAAIRDAVGSRSVLVPVPGRVIPALAAGLNLVLRDTLLTSAEYASMAANLADSAAPATGTVAFTDWVRAHGGELGRRYANELDRHYRLGSGMSPTDPR
ncbi:MAG TPA: NAD(P)H-binding protein [Streptosporangiaceae bacterium]|nr:NAD(P)H-binding protein [Streptosporangiaceae bacterium]